MKKARSWCEKFDFERVLRREFQDEEKRNADKAFADSSERLTAPEKKWDKNRNEERNTKISRSKTDQRGELINEMIL